jgi:hypothetical protein
VAPNASLTARSGTYVVPFSINAPADDTSLPLTYMRGDDCAEYAGAANENNNMDSVIQTDIDIFLILTNSSTFNKFNM